MADDADWSPCDLAEEVKRSEERQSGGVAAESVTRCVAGSSRGQASLRLGERAGGGVDVAQVELDAPEARIDDELVRTERFCRLQQTASEAELFGWLPCAAP